MYVDKQSAGRLVVVRRPLLVGGEVEGMGRLKGDLDLLGEELLGELRVGLGERDGLGVEADPGGEGGECPRQGRQEHSVGSRHLFVVQQGEFCSQ